MPKDMQICKLPDKHFNALKLKYGQLVEVNTSNAKVICEARLLNGVSTINGMLLSTNTYKSDSIYTLQDGFVEEFTLKTINKSNVSSINIVVYVTDDYFVKNTKFWPRKLNYCCKNLLQGKLTSPGLFFHFSSSKIAKKAMIEAIEVISLSNKDAQCCSVTPLTALNIERIEQFQYFLQKNEDLYDRLFVESPSFKLIPPIFRAMVTAKTKVTSILVWGPSGSGKATLVKRWAKECDASVVSIDAVRLNSNVREMKSILKLCRVQDSGNTRKCFLIFRRVDVFLNQPSNPTASHLIEDILSSDSMRFNGRLCVFITANNLSDVGTCCSEKVFVGLPSREERLEYFQKFFAQEMDIQNSAGIGNELASCTEGQNWRNINTLVQMILKAKAEAAESKREFTFKADDVLMHKRIKKPEGVHVAHEDVAPVLGCEESKQELLQTIFWPKSHSDALRRMHLAPDRAVLLYGEPGCGKTSLVRMLAHESKMTLFCVSAADIYSPYFGNSEKQLIDIFAQAKASTPSILFFDEIDCLAGNRKCMESNSVQNRVACTLFLCMDSIGCSDRNLQIASENRVVLIATTNIPEKIDPSLKRRFDRIIKVELPDKKVRIDILEHYTSKMPVHPQLDLEELAELTERLSGADLECLCKKAFQFCMRDSDGKSNVFVELNHFKEALKGIKKETNNL